MLRRVARVLRMLLLGLGACILLWLPFSWFFRVGISYPTSHASNVGFAQHGVLVVWHINDPMSFDAHLGVSRARSSPYAWPRMQSRDLIWPRFTKEDLSTTRSGRSPPFPDPAPPLQQSDLDTLTRMITEAVSTGGVSTGPPKLRTGIALRLPLWLLAFICLAWPVTSFIVARRRRKGRGFEVEARPGAAAAPASVRA